MSHPDPTYYHPSSCDCQGCRDNQADARASAAAAEALVEGIKTVAVAAPLTVAGLAVVGAVGPLVIAAAPVVAAAAVPMAVYGGIKYFSNYKNLRAEIEAKNAPIIDEYNQKISTLISKLNSNYKNRPLPPVNTAFSFITFTFIIISIILFFTPAYLVIFPLVLMYGVYFYYESTPNRKKIHQKYKEDYAMWEKEYVIWEKEFDEKNSHIKNLCIEAISEFEQWYRTNDYRISFTNSFFHNQVMNAGELVTLKLKSISKFYYKTRDTHQRYKMEYYYEGIPAPSSFKPYPNIIISNPKGDKK